MNEKSAKKAGSREAMKAVGIGILIAQIMMTSFSDDETLIQKLLWFRHFDYKLNLIIGVALLFLSGHYFGKKAGDEIILKKRNFVWTGIKYGFATLTTASILGSLTGFFQEGIPNIGTNDNPINDYILKPVFWILAFGFIPVLLVSIWFGKQIKKKEKQQNALPS